MKIVTIQDTQREQLLGKIKHVFQRRKRPDTTPVFCKRVQVPKR